MFPKELVLSRTSGVLGAAPSVAPAQRGVADEAGAPGCAPWLRRETTCRGIASMRKMEPPFPWFITTATPVPGRGQEKVHRNSGVEFWTQSTCAGVLRAGAGSQGSAPARAGCRCPDAHQGTRQPPLAESSLLESSSSVLSPPVALLLQEACPHIRVGLLLPSLPPASPPKVHQTRRSLGENLFYQFFFSYYKITCGHCRKI